MLNRRGICVTVGALLVAVGSAGCTLNKGTAFEQQFTPFLEDRGAIASFELNSSNVLPGAGDATIAIVLDDGLDDDEIVEEVLDVAHHEVEDQVGYDLQVAFDTENGAGVAARTSLYVNVFEPMPDTQRSRDIIAERVERGRDIAAADDGLVELVADGYQSTVVTTSDPLETAVELAPLIAGADELGRTAVRAPEGGVTDTVELPAGADAASLEDLVAILALVRQTAEPTSYRAVAATDEVSASLTVDLVTVPADPRPLVEAAEELDVALVLPTPAPVTPAPTAPAPTTAP